MTKISTAILHTVVLTGCMVLIPSIIRADDVDKQLKIIAAVGPNGTSSQAAAKARDQLLKRGPEIFPQLLVAMDTPNVIAANWYRSLFERLISRELKKDSAKLPVALFRRFVEDPKRQGRLRRRLLAILEQHTPGYRAKLMPHLLNDPEFRDDAVAFVMTQGTAATKKGDKQAAIKAFQLAFKSARNSRQIMQSADRLKALGEPVSIINHMGFVTDWYLLGPFNAPGKTGFTLSFPPENNINLTATYPGKASAKIGWKRFHTTDRLGQINLNQAISSVKEAVGYGYARLHSPRKQTAELRCGADDNITVWLNGKKVFTRLQWLNGTRLDRFTAPVELKAGRNDLLVKICQGPQHKNPAVPNNWSMQLRFCSKDGNGSGLTSLLPALPKRSK